MRPDAERGPATGPRPEQFAWQLTVSEDHDTPTPGALIDGSHLQVLDAELEDVLADRREVAR